MSFNFYYSCLFIYLTYSLWTIWNSYSVFSPGRTSRFISKCFLKRRRCTSNMTSIWHVALSLLQLQLLAPRHCHLKMRKSCNMWKWPLKIKQLSLSPVSQGKRKKWHAETSVWSKKESSSICGWNWKLECEGGREGKKEGCEVKERDGWLKSDSSGGQARSYGSRFFGPAVFGEESTSSSAAFHQHTCLKSALDTSAEFKPANMLASFVLSEVRRRR